VNSEQVERREFFQRSNNISPDALESQVPSVTKSLKHHSKSTTDHRTLYTENYSLIPAHYHFSDAVPEN
jgi:hypothetical protein